VPSDAAFLHDDAKKYMKFLENHRKTFHDNLYSNHARNLISLWTAAQGRVSVLRDHLHKVSSGPVPFFSLRLGTTKSLAAYSVLTYLLGIGDRHLENLMWRRTDGALVGIDYGMAFGYATRKLPFPEMVPFRLTPVLQALFHPLSSTSMFQPLVRDVLDLAKKNQNAILPLVETFLVEPLSWWSEDRSDCDGSTCSRLHIMERKFSMENPASIIAAGMLLFSPTPFLRPIVFFANCFQLIPCCSWYLCYGTIFCDRFGRQ
jgi:hypothetical protein